MNTKKTANKTSAANASVSWTKNAWEDYMHWHEVDKRKVHEINNLICECLKDPFKGTGKPEPLKGDLSGFLSRRIDKVHRLVYVPQNGCVCIAMCRFHYDK